MPRDIVRHRKARTQKIVSWNPADAEPSTATASTAAEEKIREALAATGAPMPLDLLLAKASVSRSAVLRLEKTGRLLVWEEPLTPDEDAWTPTSRLHRTH